MTDEDQEEIDKIVLLPTDIITVCDICLRSSCWHGEFMCDDADCAGTINLTVDTLRKIQKHLNSYHIGEHEDYWKADKWERA